MILYFNGTWVYMRVAHCFSMQLICYCSYELNHAFAVNLAWKVILKIYYDLFVPNISSAGTHQQAALQGVYKPLVVLNLIERVKPRAENR